MNAYNYNHLFYFYVAARLEGVTAAAKYLHTSQSSLSIQIKTLEGALNKELFKKSGRRMELTDDGKAVFNYCKRAFGVFDEMFDRLNRRSASMGLRATIGVSTDLDRPFVADILAGVFRKYRGKDRPLIRLLSLPSNELFQGLRLGEIDFLISGGIVADQEMEVLADFSMPVRAVASRAFQQEIRSMPFDEVCRSQEFGFVLPSKNIPFRGEIDSYLVKRRANPAVVFESNVFSAVIRAATDGLGVLLAPEGFIAKELRSEHLLPLGDKVLWKYRVALVTLKDRLNESYAEFSGHFVSELGKAMRTF